jgi:hypothetical protein
MDGGDGAPGGVGVSDMVEKGGVVVSGGKVLGGDGGGAGTDLVSQEAKPALARA